uniref:Uncharacterized protein n=1 Tax=Arundo donax TaxID=35708 RepID=A0A0A9CX63_ARUDO
MARRRAPSRSSRSRTTLQDASPSGRLLKRATARERERIFLRKMLHC